MQYAYPQKVLFKHCDPAGMVFYPRYFEMINDCVEGFFEQAGYPFPEMLKTSGVPTAEITVKFLAPSRHGDALTLLLQIVRLGTTSMTLDLRAVAADELRFTGTSTLVHISTHGKPTPWPDNARMAFIPYIRSAS
jgi:4-hydroxybenzoyl-CoA thioesterase